MWVKQGLCTEQKQPVTGSVCLSLQTRETREGWPLLTVETEAKGTLGVHMKGVLPWLVRSLSLSSRDIFFAAHFLNWAQCAGSRAGLPVTVSLHGTNPPSQARVFRQTEQAFSLTVIYL